MAAEKSHAITPIGTLATTIAAILLLAGGAMAAEEAATLTPDQQAMAARMQAFQDQAQAAFFARVKRFNGKADIETRVFDYDTATHTVKVSRGKVVEKAGWYTNVQKKGMPPMVPDPLFSRYMEIDVHPATPHVGMLHATIYFTYLRNGVSVLAGYMDYVPAVVHDDDNQRLRTAVEQVFAHYGADIAPYRRELCESRFGAEHHLQGASCGFP